MQKKKAQKAQKKEKKTPSTQPRGRPARLVHGADALDVRRRRLEPRRIRKEERVVRVPRRVLLRLEQRVKVPKRRLDKVVGRHLGVAHLQKDLPVAIGVRTE
jgi:hypothetical protein